MYYQHSDKFDGVKGLKPSYKQKTIKKYNGDIMNIILYFSDQQRYDTVNESVMPNICSMADDSIFFDNAFTCQPVCGPARACIQTGLYATQNNCYNPKRDDIH